jgi:hypothetical protein
MSVSIRLQRGIARGLLVVLLAGTGCALWRTPEGPQADPSYPIEVAEGPAIVDFHIRAASFYGRLAYRRFNVIATYRDEFLREFFRSDGAFSDYYADFARELDDAYFDRNRPGSLEVTEFSLHGPGEALVQIRIRGEDGRPLRPGAVTYRREDRWERVGGVWWIVPGKL